MNPGETIVVHDVVPDKEPLKFRAEGGRFRTQSLFLEHSYDTATAIYTMKPEDYEYQGKLYPSLRRLYLDMEDLGEYEFACTHLGGWSHWEAIANNKVFTKLVETWRHELEVKLRGRGIATISKDSSSTSRSAIASAKWMADGGWKTKKAGRPTAEDIQRETEIKADISNQYKADITRIKG